MKRILIALFVIASLSSSAVLALAHSTQPAKSGQQSDATKEQEAGVNSGTTQSNPTGSAGDNTGVQAQTSSVETEADQSVGSSAALHEENPSADDSNEYSSIADAPPMGDTGQY